MKFKGLIRKAEEFLNSGDLDKARDLLIQALGKDPHNPEAYYVLGDVFCKLGQFQDAITALQKADMLMPKHPRIYHLLGWAIFMNGDVPAGRAFMEVALTVEENNIQLLADLAVLEMNSGNFSKTKEYISRAKKIDPNDEMIQEIEMVADKMQNLQSHVKKDLN